MYRFLLTIFFVFGISTFLFAQKDPDLDNLKWSRRAADQKLVEKGLASNFTVVSIDDQQGAWLIKELDNIKKWCLTRWGLPDYQMTKECRIFCIPNKDLAKKLFNITESKWEIKRKDNKIEMSVLWLILDDKPIKVVPQFLSQVCFAGLEEEFNVNLNWALVRGMSLLNRSPDVIRQDMLKMKDLFVKDSPLFLSKKMFETTEEEYKALSLEDRKLFDLQSMYLTLMLRKEFGEAKMQGFLKLSSNNPKEDVFKTIYKFENFESFDSKYFEYMRDLSKGLEGKTPDSYLEIKAVK